MVRSLIRRRSSCRVSTETFSTDLVLRTPYRGIETGRPLLRIRVEITASAQPSTAVVIEVDDLALVVRDGPRHGDGGFVLGAGAIDALFVAERQPRNGFLTWFGVFARRRGLADQLVLEAPESRVARFVERTIEDWLGLAPSPIRGEFRTD